MWKLKWILLKTKRKDRVIFIKEIVDNYYTPVFKKIKLSEVDISLKVEEVIDYCLDRHVDTIVNDYNENLMEYDLADLISINYLTKKTIWQTIQNKIKSFGINKHKRVIK